MRYLVTVKQQFRNAATDFWQAQQNKLRLFFFMTHRETANN